MSFHGGRLARIWRTQGGLAHARLAPEDGHRAGDKASSENAVESATPVGTAAAPSGPIIRKRQGRDGRGLGAMARAEPEPRLGELGQGLFDEAVPLPTCRATPGPA